MQDRDSFSLKLEDTENWLYEDGEDQQKQVYIDKLAELKVTGPDVCNSRVIYKSNDNNSRANRLWLGRVIPLRIIWALCRHLTSPISLLLGRHVLMIFLSNLSVPIFPVRKLTNPTVTWCFPHAVNCLPAYQVCFLAFIFLESAINSSVWLLFNNRLLSGQLCAEESISSRYKGSLLFVVWQMVAMWSAYPTTVSEFRQMPWYCSMVESTGILEHF